MIAVVEQPRVATGEDRDLYLTFVREHVAEVGADPKVVRDIHKPLFDSFVHGENGVIVLMDDIGCLAWGSMEDRVNTARGYGMYIRPAYRGQGYARRMIKLAFEELKHLGFRKVVVTPDAENERSIRMLRSVGFQAKQVIMMKRI